MALDKNNPDGCWTPQERRVAFEVLVLQGIWIIIRLLIAKRVPYDGQVWAGQCINYFDQVGQQHPEAKQFRRDVTFGSGE